MKLSFRQKPTINELEEEKERLVVTEEIASKHAEIAEREAVIAQLKSQYGRNWAQTLGISKLTDLSTLRSFLKNAKQGLQSQATRDGSMPMGRLYDFKGVPKA